MGLVFVVDFFLKIGNYFSAQIAKKALGDSMLKKYRLFSLEQKGCDYFGKCDYLGATIMSGVRLFLKISLFSSN